MPKMRKTEKKIMDIEQEHQTTTNVPVVPVESEDENITQ